MKIRTLVVVAFVSVLCTSAFSAELTPAQEKKIDDLIQNMSLDEKLGQLTQQWGDEVQDTNPVVTKAKSDDLLKLVRAGKVGSFLGSHQVKFINEVQRVALEESKHGIPVIIGNDIIHGYRTIFPIPLAESCTWSPELVELSAHVAATEADAMGTDWTFAPMVDICRDARWGRVAEGSGEDPYLGSVMAAARVRGFQGEDVRANDAIAACTKHYAAYGAAIAGKDYNTTDMSMSTLFNTYLPPYHATVEAGVYTFMSSFNALNGVPASGSHFLMTEVLRDRWGFKGFVVSDWESCKEMIPHGYAKDKTDAAAIGLNAGVDMDMSAFIYRDQIKPAIKDGRVSMETIDTAVRRILRIKMLLGLFDNPYRDLEHAEKVILCKEHRDAAREVAKNSFVLLKNENNTLPLGENIKTIAVIGPLADSKVDPLGTWSAFGDAKDVVSVLEGIQKRAGEGVIVKHARGCEVREGGKDHQKQIAEAVELAKESDIVLLVVGEDRDMSGEAHSRSNVGMPWPQIQLTEQLKATGKPIAVLLMSGRPMALEQYENLVDSILMIWHPGVECGNAVADAVFGDFNPCGKLTTSFPRVTGQCPIYYDHYSTGRPPKADVRYTSKFIDVHWSPLHPFGYGLSYTTFKHEDLNLDKKSLGAKDTLNARVVVTNTGKREGTEVVQLYIRDMIGKLTRPVKQLKRFERITLMPGESKVVSFELPASEMGYFNNDMNYVVEPGQYKLWIGTNSEEGLEANFVIK